MTPPLSDYLVHLEAHQLMGGHGANESILPPDMGGNLMAHSDERGIITIIIYRITETKSSGRLIILHS